MYQIKYRIERDFYEYKESEDEYSDFLGDDVLEEGVLHFTEEQWCGDGVALRLFTVMLSQLPFMTEPLMRHMNIFEWRVYETDNGKLYEFSDDCVEGDAIKTEVDYALIASVWKDGKELEDSGASVLHRLGLESSGLIETKDHELGFEY